MKQVPTVKILDNEFIQNMDNKFKKEFCDACPSKVFKIDKDEIIVDKSEKCTYCEECLIKTQEFIKKKDKTEFKKYKENKIKEGMKEDDIKMNQGPSINYREVIKIEPKANEFLFKVESTGALSPKKIVYEAFNILKQKFNSIDKMLNEIEEKNN